MRKNIFTPFLKWKHPSIWQQFSCDRKFPFDDYELYFINTISIEDTHSKSTVRCQQHFHKINVKPSEKMSFK